MSLTVVGPGEPAVTVREAPAIDTGALDSPQGGASDRGGPTWPSTPSPRSTPVRSGAPTRRLRDKGSLRYFEVHAGFVHHTVNANDYSRDEVPGILREHLRLPHAVARLERRRLQLPGRPVRPDLGGPVRRRRPPGRRRPHPGLQRPLLRDVGDRQLRDRPAAAGDGARPTARCSPGSSSLHGVDAGSTRQQVGPDALPGDQRPPRRRPDRLPGTVPLRPAGPDPRARRRRPAGLVRARAPVRPRREPPPRPGGPPRQRRQGLRAPHRWAHGLRRGPWSAPASPPVPPRWWPRRTSPGTAAATCSCSVPTGPRAVPGRRRRRATTRRPVLPGGFAGRDLLTAVGDLDDDGDHDLVARDPDGQAAGLPRGRRRRLHPAAARRRLDRLDLARRLRRPRRRRHVRTCSPATPRRRSGCSPAPTEASAPPSGWPAPGPAGGAITGYGDFTRDGGATCSSARDRRSGVRPPLAGRPRLRPSAGPGHAAHEGLGTVLGAAQLLGDGTPDVVARRGERRPDLPQRSAPPSCCPPSRPASTSAAPTRCSTSATGTATATATWSCGPRRGVLFLRPGDGTGRFAEPGPDRHRLRRRPAARGRRRHDRRRLARPDGPAAGGVDADLPRRRARRASATATSPTARSTPPGRWRRPLGRRRRARQPVPLRRHGSRSTRATAPAG